ncbi:MAG: VWA domain-containing protein [Burkholderiaceae bacterium]|nr:VWA domain-containing protein [Burkholderiaceae bacterium]
MPGHLADNVVHFARVLRAAGVPVGTDRVLLALDALKVAGLAARDDLRATLHCCLIDRAEHRAIFDQAFHVFWKDPDLLGQMMRMLLPQVSEKQGGAPPPPPENRRLAEALFKSQREVEPPPAGERIEIDAQMSWSEREALRKADFDTMSTAEWNAARRMLATIAPLFAPLVTRRLRSSATGARIDLRALLRDSARRGGEIVALPRSARRTRPAPLVALVDISGSMSRYSRMFLHFLHAISAGRNAADLRVQSFVFGTRLSNITRPLRRKDPDEAMRAVVQAVDDWSGGTRIAQALAEFNRRWARRVLPGSATVLLVTDGLEHADLALLEREAAMLSRSCRRLLWLNPLLRYEAFQPRARGVRALLPHVDAFLPVHNVDSLESLARVLASPRATLETTTWN